MPTLLVPPFESATLQVTAVLVVPVTVAANCCVAPYPMVALVGEIEMLTLLEVGFEELLPPPPPQPAAAIAKRAQSPIAIGRRYFINSARNIPPPDHSMFTLQA